MLKPIRRQSLPDAVFEQLRQQIVRGEIAVGDALPAERQLAEMLRVNRGAVREALRRLEQAGLVATRQGGGTKVLDFRRHASMDLLGAVLVQRDGTVNTRVARSIIEMRSALAPDIARLAALRGGGVTADALERVAAEMAAAGADLTVLQRLGLDFWEALVDGADNLAYRLSFNALRRAYSCFDHLLTDILADELADLDGYRAIAAAVRAGDGDLTERLVREQTDLGAAGLTELICGLEQAKAEAPTGEGFAQ